LATLTSTSNVDDQALRRWLCSREAYGWNGSAAKLAAVLGLPPTRGAILSLGPYLRVMGYETKAGVWKHEFDGVRPASVTRNCPTCQGSTRIFSESGPLKGCPDCRLGGAHAETVAVAPLERPAVSARDVERLNEFKERVRREGGFVRQSDFIFVEVEPGSIDGLTMEDRNAAV
jgi:hypothetical protein